MHTCGGVWGMQMSRLAFAVGVGLLQVLGLGLALELSLELAPAPLLQRRARAPFLQRSLGQVAMLEASVTRQVGHAGLSMRQER